MTFDRFIATRRASDNLAAEPNLEASYFEDANRNLRIVPGFVYGGDAYIERLEDGRFYLILFNEEYISADLGELEDKLYQWCVDEGFWEHSPDRGEVLIERAASAARVEHPAIAPQLYGTDVDRLLTVLREHEDEKGADVSDACAALCCLGEHAEYEEARAEVDAYVSRVYATRSLNR